ncbi:MAG: outer membrane lipoprotein-sorting protein, partial [Myxococcales bacterium]|nr:outer membrane lipoprotein-sorting protein [Myxococcales bacterium]
RKGDDKLIKTMFVRRTSMVDGKLTVTHMLMRDEKKQSQTDMVLDNITIDDKIDDALFTKASLERP